MMPRRAARHLVGDPTKWRAKAKGPPFIKVGRLVRYRRSDVDAWLRANTVGTLAA